MFRVGWQILPLKWELESNNVRFPPPIPSFTPVKFSHSLIHACFSNFLELSQDHTQSTHNLTGQSRSSSHVTCVKHQSYRRLEMLTSYRLSKCPCQEDGSEHEDSDPDNETDSSENNQCSSQVIRIALAALTCWAGLERCKQHCPRYMCRTSFQQSSFWKEVDYSRLVYAIVITCTTRLLLHMLGIGMATLTE